MSACTWCGCTEDQACEGGCGWADDAHTICSACAGPREIAIELVKILGAVVTNPKAGMRAAAGTWDELTTEQQHMLVETCRATVEGIRLACLGAVELQAQEAVIEFNAITTFLLEKCPDQVGDDDTLSQVVVRLLEPHVGSRIILPGVNA